MKGTRRYAMYGVFGACCCLGAASDVEAANAVVGNGTRASCTEAALDAAVAAVMTAGEGTMTFNCGGPATIDVTSAKLLGSSGEIAIDGFGLITLSGQNVTRIIDQRGFGGALSLRNITLQNGRASGMQDSANGGAIRSEEAVTGVILNLTNVTFRNNVSNQTGVPPGDATSHYGGAAVYFVRGNLNVTNCFFSNNTANNSSGGAIFAYASTIDIRGTTFTTNASNGGGFGGAIYTDEGSDLRITASTFTNNTAFNVGGAFYFRRHLNHAVTLDTTVFAGNRVVENSGTLGFVGNGGIGGAGVVDFGNVTVLNSTFSGNSARSSIGPGSGGGLSLTSNASISITNSTFSGNQALEGRTTGSPTDSSGGGLVISGNTTPFEIRNSTFTGNHADWTGGGIQSASTGVLTNTIVADNTASNPFNIQHQCGAELTDGGGVIHFPDIVGAQNAQNPYCASGALVINPALQPLATNGGYASSHGLDAGSPAIDSGSCVVATDQRGVARPQGGACDIGAFEFTSAPAPELVYRLRHPAIGAYLFTIFPSERDSAQGSFGYLYEGPCCKWFGAPAVDGRVELHRLFSPSAGEYLFTIFTSERDSAVAQFGYIYEGVAAYCHPGSTAAASTEWHRLRLGDKHFYTAFALERDYAVFLGYTYEGVSCFLPPP